MPGEPFEVARVRSIADRRAAATEFRNRLVIADADGTVVAIGPPGPGSTRGGAPTAAEALESLLGGGPAR